MNSVDKTPEVNDPATHRITTDEAQEMLKTVLHYSESLLQQMLILNAALKSLPTSRAGVITDIDETKIN